jgi:RimJ/RimL family protein N-acetyltransferase
LARDQWGNGLAQEAVRRVLAFAFKEMDLNRVEIWTSAANDRSLKLASRLGFSLDGTLRRRILEDDRQFYDCSVFGLLRDEWEKSGLGASDV